MKANVEKLEDKIDEFNNTLSPLKNFILPGGGSASATCHLARAVCRRAERSVVMLNEETELNPQLQVYLNRCFHLRPAYSYRFHPGC